MSYEPPEETGDSELRRRAALLLVLLVLVAGLIVVVMTTLLNSSGNKGGSVADIDGPSITPTPVNSGASSASGHARGVNRGPSTGAGDSSSASGTSADPRRRPTASCPTKDMCNVEGDISGTTTAINAFRADHNRKPIQAQISDAAQKCALTSGNDCPSSFVWVHVDGLSGNDVVDGVVGFHSSDELLDPKTKSFEIGWAFDPKTHTSTCAVIGNGG